jgi:hypothetical protein
MPPDTFYQQIVDIAARPPEERYRVLTALHEKVLEESLTTIEAITPQAASRVSSDGRTSGQAVGPSPTGIALG